MFVWRSGWDGSSWAGLLGDGHVGLNTGSQSRGPSGISSQHSFSDVSVITPSAYTMLGSRCNIRNSDGGCTHSGFDGVGVSGFARDHMSKRKGWAGNMSSCTVQHTYKWQQRSQDSTGLGKRPDAGLLSNRDELRLPVE